MSDKEYSNNNYLKVSQKSLKQEEDKSNKARKNHAKRRGEGRDGLNLRSTRVINLSAI